MKEKQAICGIGKIISSKKEGKYTNQYMIKYKDNKFLLYTDNTTEFQYGDIIAFHGYFEKAKTSKNFKLFDYSRYLRQQKIYGILKVEQSYKIDEEKDLFYQLEKLKSKLKQNLFLIFDKEQAGFLEGLLLGDKTEILEETKQNFQNSNLSHILAISGMHVVYVSLGVKFLLNLVTKNQKLKNGLMICFLIFFAIFTGGSSSCLRACIMCSMIFLSKLVYRKNDFYTSLLLSLDILLVLNCYHIESVGLWLSYFSTFGIVYICINPTLKENFLLGNIKTSIACNLMIFPIISNCYNKISFTFLISNFLVSLWIGPIIILGYIHLLFGKFSIWFSWIEELLLNFILKVAAFFSNLRISKIPFPTIHLYFWIIYYLLLLSFIYFYHHKELFHQLRRKILYGISFLILVGVIILFPKNKELEIHFLDVGQGDCTVILTPSRKTILIDGGNNEEYDNGKNIVMPYLLKNGISKVDYLMVSHRRF